jgi:hypothetical protein
MVTRLVGGLTPGDGADPRTFPAIFNDAVDELESVQSGLGVVEFGLTSLGGTVVTQGSAIFLQGEAISVLEGTAVALGTAVFDLESDLSNLELGDLADVTIGTAVADGEVLAYSTAVSGWVNAEAAGGGGKILQVVSTVKTDVFSTASTTYVDVTGMSVSITPSSASSKVLVIVTLQGGQSGGDGLFQLLRGATAIALSTSGSGRNGFAQVSSSYQNSMFTCSIAFLDSPSTTSATTYKVQGVANAGTTFVNRRGVNDSFGGSSTITVMEVAD